MSEFRKLLDLMADLMAVADGVREADSNCCKVCGLHYDACKYPISHSHPTIENIELDSPEPSLPSGPWGVLNGRPQYELDRPRGK